MTNQKYIYYFITAVVFAGLKFWYITASHDQLPFILQPTDALVSLFTGASSSYDPAYGYFYPYLNITIEKSCSGVNFWLLSFALFVFVSLNHLHSRKEKLLVIPLMLLISYVLTLFVNASRIVISIAVNDYIKTIHLAPANWLHQAEGTFIYLLSLILAYAALQFFFTQHALRYEKTT